MILTEPVTVSLPIYGWVGALIALVVVSVFGGLFLITYLAHK